ncbi:MAG: GGDEF domain-containing protein, partial [Deltaproteobacteria bacterium]
DFKTINDSFGHLVGDRVILALVEKCREIVRKNDYIARFGGDEFAIVMEGASLKNAVKKAGRLSKALATTRYAVNDAEDARELSFTVSIGVSTYRKGDTVSTVTDRADRALYAAKAAGKSRVVSEADLEKRPESV